MKRKLFTILLLLALSILPVVGSKAAVKVITIKTSTTYKIQKGEKLHLYVKGYKKSKKVKWQSSNKKIASVSKKGVVTGKKGGTCKITAKIKKKKYTCKIFVFAGENTVYEDDEDSETPNDRYDSDIDLPNKEDETMQYDEWMTEKGLEEKGLSFIKMTETTIHISGQSKKDSLTGSCKSYILEIPQELQTDTIYGDELKFKWNGNEILYNTNDMKTLELIVR